MTQYPDDKRRLVIARAVLSVREAAIFYFGDVDKVAILHAIAIGRIEGPPTDVSAIAALSSLSRQTVIRHLKRLEAEGMVKLVRQGRRVVVTTTEQSIFNPRTMNFVDKVEAVIRRVAAELSEMDKLGRK
jgi:DNA-binding transcriptional ArsR family regulator